MGSIIDLGTDNWKRIEYSKDDSYGRYSLNELMMKAAKRLTDFCSYKRQDTGIVIIGQDSLFNGYILNNPTKDKIDIVTYPYSAIHPCLRTGLLNLSTEHIDHHLIKEVFVYDIYRMNSENIRDVEIMAADNYSFGHEEMETYDLHPLYLDVEPRQLYAFMHELSRIKALDLGEEKSSVHNLYDQYRNYYLDQKR